MSGKVVRIPPMIYVAGPFSAPDRAGVETNILRAEELGINVARVGGMPVIPHANTSHPSFERVQPYEFWIGGTLGLLRACKALILVLGWERSSGARGEVAYARERDLPVFEPGTRGIAQLTLWLNGAPAIDLDGRVHQRNDLDDLVRLG